MKAAGSLRVTGYVLRLYNCISAIIVFAIFLFIATPIFAQVGSPPGQGTKPEQMEKLKSMKIAFFTERLNLTPEEAKAFWPVYNTFEEEIEKLRNEHREAMMNAKDNFDKLSDKEVEKLVDNEIAFRQNELDVFKKYNSRFKQVLPIKKVAKLYRTEEAWKRKILDLWREKKEEKAPK